jgi:hypothetical protein
MWESIRVREVMCLSFNGLQISWVYKRRRAATYHSISFFHVLFVEDILARVCFRGSFPVGFWGRNLLVGQHLLKLRCSIGRHIWVEQMEGRGRVAEVLEICK